MRDANELTTAAETIKYKINTILIETIKFFSTIKQHYCQLFLAVIHVNYSKNKNNQKRLE